MSKIDTVAAYIAAAPRPTQKKLKEMRAVVRKAAPKAQEDIRYGLAAVSYDKGIVMYGAFKNHIGFYPTPSAVNAFKKDLARYKTAKGSIQFPLDMPLPASLIRKITLFRVKESEPKKTKRVGK